MPGDQTPTPESALIEDYIRELAPSIHQVSCKKRLDGGYDLWFQLNPTSPAKQVIISNNEYSAGQSNDSVGTALEEANLE
jgi:hypothetical protein